MKVRLREVRMARGLSQNKLAQLVNMTLQNVQKIEYGKTKGLQYDSLNKLCEVLNCQPGDLLVYENESDNDEQQAATVPEKLEQSGGSIEIDPSRKRSRAFLTLVPEALETA